jgi:hypothetical protein
LAERASNNPMVTGTMPATTEKTEFCVRANGITKPAPTPYNATVSQLTDLIPSLMYCLAGMLCFVSGGTELFVMFSS